MNMDKYQNPEIIRSALGERRVAIVGLSANELRASNFVGYYLKRHGYEIVPVNPRETEILGLTCYPSLKDIPEPVGIVNVFRDPSAVPELAADAVSIGARYLWLQFGVISEEGALTAKQGGLQVVMDLCLKIEHARDRGRMHWLGFNTHVISAQRRSS